MKSRRSAAALAALCLGAPASLSAQAASDAVAAPAMTGLALHVVRLPGAERCDRGSALASGVEQRLGHRVFVPPTASAGSIEVLLSADAGGYRALVRNYGPDGAAAGEREVKPVRGECSALIDALVIVLSVMIDPEAALAARPVQPAPLPPPAAAPPTERAPDVPPAPRPAEPTLPPRRSATLFTRIGFGELPDTSVSFGAAYLQHVGPVALYADARASLTDEKRRVVESEGVRLSIATATLALCPLATRDLVVRFTVCAGAELGGWFVGSFGVRDAHAGVEPFAAGSARVAAQVALSDRIAVSVGGAGSALLLRPELSYDVNDGTRELAFHAPPLSGAAEVGLSTRF